MSLNSMTGFARADGALGDMRWHWELRSVNGKSFDCRFRLPPGIDGVEPRLREALGKHIKRGNCQASLSIDQSATPAPLRLNREALAVVVDAVREVQGICETQPPRPEGILALRGVLESGEASETDPEEKAALEAALVQSFEEAASALATARAEEGLKLETLVAAQIDEIERLTNAAAAAPAASPQAIRDRLAAQLHELLDGNTAIAEDRLAHEAAMLATKADIREELDRLTAHVEQARGLLAGTDPKGRRLDFLTQEFNREANTLCSKAADVSLTRIGLDLKAVIDQLREQIQNIE